MREVWFGLFLHALVAQGIGEAGEPGAAMEHDVVLLSLTQTHGGKEITQIELRGNQLSTRLETRVDRYYVRIDGKDVTVPEGVLWRLQSLRREFSEDQKTHGVIYQQYQGAVCAIPANGWVLETLYVTFGTNRWDLREHEMRPVFSEGNCSFVETFRPIADRAEVAARRAVTILQTVHDYAKQ